MRSATRGVVLHWTGGEGGGEQIHRTLTRRRLSVQFAIDQAGTVWQYADANAACAHCHGFNVESVGIEIANRARPPADGKWPREIYTDHIHGRDRQTARFLPEQVRAALELTRALCRAYGLPFDVPRNPDGSIVTTALPAEALRTYRGVLGHLHVTAAKDDPGTEILHAIASSP